MPVAKSTRSPQKQALILGLGALAAIATIAFLVSRLGLTAGDDSVALTSGDLGFQPGLASELAVAIEENEPFLFSDIAGGDQDVYLQHTGGSSDPTRGWYVFEAREADASRDCTITWDAEAKNFFDKCSNKTFPANGEGLQQYKVSIDGEGRVNIDLKAPLVDKN